MENGENQADDTDKQRNVDAKEYNREIDGMHCSSAPITFIRWWAYAQKMDVSLELADSLILSKKVSMIQTSFRFHEFILLSLIIVTVLPFPSFNWSPQTYAIRIFLFCFKSISIKLDADTRT